VMKILLTKQNGVPIQLTWASLLIAAPDLLSISGAGLPSEKGPITNPVSLLVPPAAGFGAARPQRPRLPLATHCRTRTARRVRGNSIGHDGSHTCDTYQTISPILVYDTLYGFLRIENAEFYVLIGVYLYACVLFA